MKLKTIKAVVAVLTIACTAAVADVTENFDGVSAQLIDPAGTVINGSLIREVSQMFQPVTLLEKTPIKLKL